MNKSAEHRRVNEALKRVDELADAESRRIDGLLKAQETAVNAALAAAEKAVAAALAASEKAVNKAEIAQQRVNETQNEFRGTLSDQAKNLMPRNESENINRELRGLIDGLTRQIGDIRSRLDIGPPILDQLRSANDQSAGRQAQAIDGRTVLFAVMGAAVGVIGIIVAVAALLTR